MTMCCKRSRLDILQSLLEHSKENLQKAKLIKLQKETQLLSFKKSLSIIQSQFNDPLHIALYDILPIDLIILCQDYSNHTICDTHSYIHIKDINCISCCPNQSVEFRLENIETVLSDLHRLDLSNIKTFGSLFPNFVIYQWEDILQQIKNFNVVSVNQRKYQSKIQKLIGSITIKDLFILSVSCIMKPWTATIFNLALVWKFHYTLASCSISAVGK